MYTVLSLYLILLLPVIRRCLVVKLALLLKMLIVVIEKLEITWLIICIIVGNEKMFCDVGLVVGVRSFAALVIAAAAATGETK